jgi:hypothetical protein
MENLVATYTVTDDRLSSEAAAIHFSTADRRVLIGIRAALELLGVPVPQYALRRSSGRPPSRVIAAACDADNPTYKPLAYQPAPFRKTGAQIVAERTAQRP